MEQETGLIGQDTLALVIEEAKQAEAVERIKASESLKKVIEANIAQNAYELFRALLVKKFHLNVTQIDAVQYDISSRNKVYEMLIKHLKRNRLGFRFWELTSISFPFLSTGLVVWLVGLAWWTVFIFAFFALMALGFYSNINEDMARKRGLRCFHNVSGYGVTSGNISEIIRFLEGKTETIKGEQPSLP